MFDCTNQIVFEFSQMKVCLVQRFEHLSLKSSQKCVGTAAAAVVAAWTVIADPPVGSQIMIMHQSIEFLNLCVAHFLNKLCKSLTQESAFFTLLVTKNKNGVFDTPTKSN